MSHQGGAEGLLGLDTWPLSTQDSPFTGSILIPTWNQALRHCLVTLKTSE